MPAPIDGTPAAQDPDAPALWADWESAQGARLLGSYQPNNSIIRLSAEANFWSAPVDHLLLERYSVFVHEYAHYLHNYSTIAGITDFCCHLYTAYFFMQANTAHGRCAGSAALSAAERAHYQALIALQLHIRGDVRAPSVSWEHGDHGHYRTLRLDATAFASPLTAEPLERITLVMEVNSPQAKPVTVSFPLGYLLIDEAISYNLQRVILQRADKPTEALDAATPTFPYKIAQAYIADETGVHPTAEQVVKIGLLALQQTDCGAAFRDVVAQLKAQPNDWAPTLERLARWGAIHVAGELPKVFARLLDPAVKDFTALLAAGVMYHRRLCEDFLRARVADPFFELALVNLRADRLDQLKAFLDRFPPCPILHEGEDEKYMFFLASEQPGQEHIDHIAAFQAFGTYHRWHAARQGLWETQALPELACPYAGYCAVPFALNFPDVCRTRPWQSYSPHDRQLCWFSTAVAHARNPRRPDPPASAAADFDPRSPSQGS